MVRIEIEKAVSFFSRRSNALSRKILLFFEGNLSYATAEVVYYRDT